MDTKQPEGFEAWAVVELMGHRRLAGFVTEQEVFGVGLLRIDVPGEGDGAQTRERGDGTGRGTGEAT